MIVRISTEGQYRFPDEDADRLNDLDNSVVEAVQGGDEDAFHERFEELLALIRSEGSLLDGEELEGSDVILSDVMTNPLRTGLFTTLREMGASIEESHVRGDAGEPMAQFRVRASKLRGVEVPPERAPSMIDEYLVLAVAASFAEGTTIMRGLQELRVKESDRLEATADMLRVNGVKVTVSGDDLIVEGRGHVPGGGTVATHMDHRIAMSALVMGLAADKPVKVDDTAFIATSFPDFIPMMRGLGAEFS